MVSDRDEFVPGLAAGIIARETGATYDEVMKMIEEPFQRVYEASKHQGQLGTCHYCGRPAYGWGFFDEPVCKQCGG